MWDNTARRKHDATILTNSTPERYEEWLRTVILRSKSVRPKADLVFVNAWNEWAEGNHLEPCQKWGDAYLKATRRAVEGAA
jgi:lipopolysaccharide biosynthesis protein